MSRPFPIRASFALAAAWLASTGWLAGQATAHYFDLSTMGSTVHARVNGFEICHSMEAGGFSHSEFITPYLVDGKNEIVVTSLVPGDVEAVPSATWVRFGVVAAPTNLIRSAQEPGEQLLSREFEPVEMLRFPAFGEDEAKVLDGRMSPDTGPIRFASKSSRRWAWGLRILKEERRIAGRPAFLNYVGLNQTLALAEVHLLDSKSGHHLVQKNLKLPAGGGTVDLAAAPLAGGIEVPADADFDTIWIFGFSAEGVEEVRMLGFDLVRARAVRTTRGEFAVDLPYEWIWRKGAVVADVTNDAAMREELVAFLKKLHETLDTRPAGEWAPFFEAKLGDLTKATGGTEEQVRAGQVAFFESLVATPGWKLEPFDPARLLIHPVNDRVLAVSYVDTEGPILSVPLKKPGSDKIDRFKMPLFVSKIGGEWNIVR